MEIGDKVRLLHSREEGIVRRFIDKKTVEIEIEDGFTIPVLTNEVVAISQEEYDRFPDRKNKPTPKAEEIIEPRIEEEDILLAIETGELEVTLWLINMTEGKVFFTVNSFYSNTSKGITSGSLKKKEYARIESWDLRSQEKWPALIIDLLRFSHEKHQYYPPVSKKIRITDKLLVKKPQPLPQLKSKGVTLSLMDTLTEINPEKIRESFYTDKKIVNEKDLKTKIEDLEVDLHIESLVNDIEELNQQEILEIQINHFEKKLEDAVIFNADSITFIHGVGNGTLRYSIHKKLSQYPHVKYFEDARKEKFGYGATKVYLK